MTCDRCHSVNRITYERRNECRPNLTGIGLARVDPLEVINFWWWSGSVCGFRITFSLSSPLWNRGFFGHLLAFLIQSTADLYHPYLATRAQPLGGGPDPPHPTFWRTPDFWNNVFVGGPPSSQQSEFGEYRRREKEILPVIIAGIYPLFMF